MTDMRAELLAWIEGMEKMEQAATPGPWEYDPHLDCSWLRTVGDPYGHGQMHVADVMTRGWGHMTGRGGGLAWTPEKAAAVQEANARILPASRSALPSLLKWARRVVEGHSKDSMPSIPDGWCSACSDGNTTVHWPCPTIREAYEMLIPQPQEREGR